MARREALGKGIGALFSQETEIKTPETSVITNESEVISKKSEVGTPEPSVITNESEVISKKSEVGTPEPSVITNESEVISKKSEVGTSEPSVITNESEVISKELGAITLGDKKRYQKQRSGSRGSKNRQRSPAMKTMQMSEAMGSPRLEPVNQEILEQAINEAQDSPRISTWSPLVMSALRYLQLTTTRFSMSREVSETLEAAFKEKYPELLERIERELEEK